MSRTGSYRIRHTGVMDPYFFAGAGSEPFSSDPGFGSERVRKKTQLFYLRLKSQNLNKVPV